MVFAFLSLLICLVIALILRAFKMNYKAISVVILSIIFLFSIGICISKPIMHKQFSIDIVEYIMKINDDGSMSTTKQVTKTILKKEQKDSQNNEKNF